MPSKVFGGGKGKGRRSRRRGETEGGKGKNADGIEGIRVRRRKTTVYLRGASAFSPPVPRQPPARVAGACATPDGMGPCRPPDASRDPRRIWDMGYGIWDMMRADALLLSAGGTPLRSDPLPRLGSGRPSFPRSRSRSSRRRQRRRARGRSPKGRPSRVAERSGAAPPRRGPILPPEGRKRNERERSKEKERNIYYIYITKERAPRSARPRQLPLALRALAPHGRAPPRG